MKYEWRNAGEPVDGFYEAVVDMEDGRRPQVFRGATYKAVADALLEAQAHATRRIGELHQQQRPQPAPDHAPVAVPLTADERMQLAHDISDPAKSDAAVERILLSKGIQLQEVSELIAERKLRQAESAAVAEAEKFAAAAPDWYPTDHNKLTLFNFMQSQGMQPTADNFMAAFERLRGVGLLQQRSPEEPEPETVQPAAGREPIPLAQTRPRRTLSTGVRSAQGSAATTPAQGRPRYTKRDLDKLTLADLAYKISHEPGFDEAVAQARR